MAIVISFIYEENDCDEAEACLDRVNTERPLPFLGCYDESCKQWAKIRRKDNQASPDIDLSAGNIVNKTFLAGVLNLNLRMLVEEEDILFEN